MYRWDYSYQAQQEVPHALATMSFNNQSDDNLYMDSEATNHIVQFAGTLINPSPFKGNDFVMGGNSDKLSSTHISNKNIGRNLHLKDVLVVPKLKKKLISISKFVKDNACSLEFTDKDFNVKDKKTGITLAKEKIRMIYTRWRETYMKHWQLQRLRRIHIRSGIKTRTSALKNT